MSKQRDAEVRKQRIADGVCRNGHGPVFKWGYCKPCYEKQLEYRSRSTTCSRCHSRQPSKGAICDRCRERKRYVPLDEINAMPIVRVLRALKHFDWVGTADLFIAADLGEAQRDASAAALSRAWKRGQVDRMELQGMGAADRWQYRINDAGRTELQSLLEMANPIVATDDEIAAHDAELAQYGRSAA